MRLPYLFKSLLGAILLGAGAIQPLSAATALPEFAYREFNLQVTAADGRVVPGASVCGFCRGFNLLWPRTDPDRDRGLDGTIPWKLGRTGDDGRVKVVVPPGRWSFFAAGQTADHGTIVAAWSEAVTAEPGKTLYLRPAITRQWTLCSRGGLLLAPKCLFLRPERFPIWLPVRIAQTNAALTVEFSAGNMQLCAEGDATGGCPGFVLSWGTVNQTTPNGALLPRQEPATIQCRGANGHSRLAWRQNPNIGLQGDVALGPTGTAWFSPGPYAIGYRRPVTPTLTGAFAAQVYLLKSREALCLTLDGPLAAELDQAPARDGMDRTVFARLYMVDVNGHPLAELFDAGGAPARIEATVLAGGHRYAARQMRGKRSDVAGEGEGGVNMFEAPAPFDPHAVWEFRGLEGVLSQTRFMRAAPVTVRSPTFEMAVPRLLARHAGNVLQQAEATSRAMETITGRKRAAPRTRLDVTPRSGGASADHKGRIIHYGSGIFLSSAPTFRHTFPHELGHNFGFTHGGLQETVVEATRSAGGEQLSEQLAKWMFMDRMNGIKRREVLYPNTGLYLYGYAQGGQPFLKFLIAHEATVKRKLGRTGPRYTDDELTAALLTLALARDLTSICQAYGLKVSPDRVTQATAAARLLCAAPKR